jgi:hypothetical protein
LYIPYKYGKFTVQVRLLPVLWGYIKMPEISVSISLDSDLPGSGGVAGDFLLLETGDLCLTEEGDYIILE